MQEVREKQEMQKGQCERCEMRQEMKRGVRDLRSVQEKCRSRGRIQEGRGARRMRARGEKMQEVREKQGCKRKRRIVVVREMREEREK